MHEHIQESLLLGRRTKGNFAGSRKGLSAEDLLFLRKEMTN